MMNMKLSKGNYTSYMQFYFWLKSFNAKKFAHKLYTE